MRSQLIVKKARRRQWNQIGRINNTLCVRSYQIRREHGYTGTENVNRCVIFEDGYTDNFLCAFLHDQTTLKNCSGVHPSQDQVLGAPGVCTWRVSVLRGLVEVEWLPRLALSHDVNYVVFIRAVNDRIIRSYLHIFPYYLHNVRLYIILTTDGIIRLFNESNDSWFWIMHLNFRTCTWILEDALAILLLCLVVFPSCVWNLTTVNLEESVDPTPMS